MIWRMFGTFRLLLAWSMLIRAQEYDSEVRAREMGEIPL
jgi:hypothetical protein